MPARSPGAVEAALEKALQTVSLLPADAAATELARTYARSIDDQSDPLDKIGARLLDVLGELGMTPKARAAVTKGNEKPADPKLDELRAAREKRTAKR